TVNATIAGDGVHNFYAVITDMAGNSSACTDLTLGYTLATGASLSVVHYYPGTGAKYNSYVAGDGGDIFTHSGTPCSGAENKRDECIDVGDLLKVDTLLSSASCATHKLRDELGVFNWQCRDSAGNAQFYTAGYSMGRSIQDMIDFAAPAWKQNRVYLNDGVTDVNNSPLATWFTNPMADLPPNNLAGVTVLPNSDWVYVLEASAPSDGYKIFVDSVTVVFKPGAELQYSGAAPFNCNWTNQITADDKRCLFHVDAVKHFRLEGAQLNGNNGTMADNGVVITSARFSTIHNLKAQHLVNYAVYGKSNSYSLIDGVEAANLGGGVLYSSAFDSVISHIKVFNYSINGVQLNNGSACTLSHLVLVNGYTGIQIGGAERATFSHVTIANMSFRGISWNGGGGINNTFVQTVISNAVTGISIGNNNGNQKFSNLAVTNSDTGIYMTGAGTAQNAFVDNFIVGGNSIIDCEVSGAAADSGLVQTTCTDSGTDGSSSYTGSPQSSAILRTGRNLTADFVGKAISDAVNTTPGAATTGQASYSDGNDWLNLENPFRAWGMFHANPFLDPGMRGQCTAGTCQIYDVRLQTTAAIFNRSLDGNNPNTAFVPLAACPAAINGNKTIIDENRREVPGIDGDEDGICESGETCSGSNEFLVNASEVISDRIGDNDGLCESGEACVYSPNFGAYQGEGIPNPAGACNFADGSVSAVTMYALTVNGAPSTIPAGGQILFATSTGYQGNFGGLAAADKICQIHAASAALPKPMTYKAVLSDVSTNANSRFSVPGQVFNRAGSLLANGSGDLWDSSLASPVQYDEKGMTTGSSGVWTNTAAAG
ncbi:MAG: right-handed parallel beta-helix repeat-containing protein, partial [Bdellovibrionales bacterium]|nr:right-handed parallel beta-helix repeat-containing protein [Bdellovibrionales bacterium]